MPLKFCSNSLSQLATYSYDYNHDLACPCISAVVTQHSSSMLIELLHPCVYLTYMATDLVPPWLFL